MQRCSNRRSVAAKPQWQSQRCNTRKRAERARTERPNRVRARAAGRPSHGAHGRGDPQRAGAHAQQARSHCFRSSCCSPTLRGRSGQQGGRHAPTRARPLPARRLMRHATDFAAKVDAGKLDIDQVAGVSLYKRLGKWSDQCRAGPNSFLFIHAGRRQRAARSASAPRRQRRHRVRAAVTRAARPSGSSLERGWRVSDRFSSETDGPRGGGRRRPSQRA